MFFMCRELYRPIFMDVITEVICDSKLYIHIAYRFCRVVVWPCPCGFRINICLNYTYYIIRKTENPRLRWASRQPTTQSGPFCVGCSCGPCWLQSFLHKAPSLFLSGSGFVAWRKISLDALACPLSSCGIWSTAKRLFRSPLVKPGAKRRVCIPERTFLPPIENTNKLTPERSILNGSHQRVVTAVSCFRQRGDRLVE